MSNTELASKAEANSSNNSSNTKEQSKYATLRNVPRPIVEFCKSEIPGVLQTDAVSAYILAMSNNRIVDLDHQISDEVRELALLILGNLILILLNKIQLNKLVVKAIIFKTLFLVY